MKKRLLSIILSIAVLISMIPALSMPIFAEEDNQIGENVYWTFDEATATLTIEGTGLTFDYETYQGLSPYGQSPLRDHPIKHIIIGEGITYIGQYLFWGCDQVEDVFIPNTVTSIGDGAFLDCNSLAELTVPGNVKTIGEGAFMDCYALSELIIENGVETIKAYAFSYSERLKSVSFPASISSIDSLFCDGSYNLVSITVDEQNEKYSSIDGVLYSKNLENLIIIPPGRDEELRVPSGVKVIATNALIPNAKLTGLSLPDTIETLETYSIQGSKLTQLDLGEGLKTLCAYALYVGDISELVLPASVEYIGEKAIQARSYTLRKIIILSQDCEIYDDPENFRNNWSNPVIYGFQDSSAQAYTTKYGLGFKIVGCDEGVHDYSVTEYPATCTENGLRTYKCKKCRNNYTEDIPALGHEYKGKTTVSPTCLEKGETTYTCTRCEDTYAEIDIPALGHNYRSIVTAPTCTEKGYTTNTCTRCNDTYTSSETAALGHDYKANVVAPTCTEKGYTIHTCSRCGDSYTDTYTDAVGHSYTATVVKPSCTGRGYTEHTCSRCGDSYQDEYVAALGHNYVDKTIAPTCIEKGYVLHSCSRCDVTYTSDETAALGHDWDDGVVTLQPTETTTGVRTFTCKRCSETKTEVIPESDHVHAYTAEVTPPTCTEKGYTTHTCRCGDSYVDTEVAALGHDYKAVVTEPTCTEVGYTTDTCSRCGDTAKRSEVPALGHDYKSNVTKPTCTEKGYTTDTCTRCGDTRKHSEVNALGHSWDQGKERKPASVYETGIKVFTCTRCKETKEETIPKLSSCNGGSGCPTSAYLDIPAPKNWAHAGIDFCVHEGLMSSTSTEKLVFSPAEKTSRAMIVVILYRLEGSPKTTYKSVFNDVPDGRWFSKGIIWAQNNGIVTGYGKGKFGPNDVITREQLATIMRRYTAFKGYKTNQKANLSSFPDSKSVSGWAQGGVAWAVKFGLINGKGTSSGTILDPKGYATRAETATILMRYIQRQNELQPLNNPADCAHDWERVSTQSATCTKEGLATYQCFACGSDYTETLPKTDHKYSKKTTAPTCTAGGYDTYTCSVCGYSYTTNKTSALGHNYVNGSCTRCGAKDPNSGTGKVLTTEEVYAKCSPAVFSIYTLDAYNNGLAQGSGFFVSSNGVFVTNAHVVENAAVVGVIFNGQILYADKVIAVNWDQDWAVLQVSDAKGVPYLPIGSKSTVVGGATIYTIGSPVGLDKTISTGIISNPSRPYYGVNEIQITASISHGSSGGALINKYGQVIGITAGVFSTEGNDLYRAIPIEYLKSTLRANGVSCPD